MSEYGIEGENINEYLSWFCAIYGPDDAEIFELVHDFAGAIVSYAEASLQGRCGGCVSGLNEEACALFNERVAVSSGAVSSTADRYVAAAEVVIGCVFG